MPQFGSHSAILCSNPCAMSARRAGDSPRPLAQSTNITWASAAEQREARTLRLQNNTGLSEPHLEVKGRSDATQHREKSPL